MKRKLLFTLGFLVLISLLTIGSGYGSTGDGVAIAGNGNDKGLYILLDVPGIVRNPDLDCEAHVVVVNSAANGTEVLLKEINLSAGTQREKVKVNKRLPSISQEIDEIEQSRNTPGYHLQSKNLQKRIDDKTHYDSFKLDLKKIYPSVEIGETFTVTVTAEIEVGGVTRILEETTDILVSSQISKMTGWVAGDGHIHTQYSPEPLDVTFYITIRNVALRASDMGLDYVIITDHDKGFEEEGIWEEYLEDCRIAQQVAGITVMPGMEISAVLIEEKKKKDKVHNLGDYIAYNISRPVSRWRADGQPKTHQEIINDVINAGGFGFIAHPFHCVYPWENWDVTGYVGMEVFSGTLALSKANQIYKKWDELSRQDRSWIGLGNSDAHTYGAIGEHFSYVYTGGSTEPASIYNALQQGRVVISNGIMAAFRIRAKDAYIGDTIWSDRGEEIELEIYWPYHQNLTQVTVVHNGKKKSYKVTSEDNENASKKVFITAQESGYVRIEALRYYGGQTPFEYAYTNPIIVKVPERIDVNGNLYAGTSNPGRIYNYSSKDGTWKFMSGVLGRVVLSITEFEDTLYAGVISDDYRGKIYRYDKDLAWRQVGADLDWQVSSLIVWQGDLYAGTSGSGAKLYRYDKVNDDWTLLFNLGRSGIRSMKVWDNALYLGDYNRDVIWRYDGASVSQVMDTGGSCIWDFEAYAGYLYAGAWLGIIYRSSDGVNWNTWHVDQNRRNIWALQDYKHALYVGMDWTGYGPRVGQLWKYDRVTMEKVCEIPANYYYEGILSLATDGKSLFIGTGKEAGYYTYSYGTGQGIVYVYDDQLGARPISRTLGEGIQVLYLQHFPPKGVK